MWCLKEGNLLYKQASLSMGRAKANKKFKPTQ